MPNHLFRNEILTLALLSCVNAFAATPATQKMMEKEILTELKRPIKGDFQHLLGTWQKKYSVKAVPVLLKAARLKNNEDASRYVALMGVAKLGGQASESEIRTFLKDKSWMLRSGALRALGALGREEKSGRAVLSLLQDKALVVRLEAVQTVSKLWPSGADEALTRAILDQRNFHAGRAQWVPQAALSALATKARSRLTAKRLLPFLEKPMDSALLPEAVRALERMTGKELAPGQSLTRKVQAWQRDLRSS